MKPFVKKALTVVLAAVCAVYLSACSLIGGDVATLMRPPRPPGELYEIQKVLESSVKDITMKYPRSGEFRSAYIMQDIDGDGQDEVLTFYSTKGDGQTSGTLYLHVLTRASGKWKTLDSKVVKDAAGVETVAFVDLDNDGSLEIIVGYTLLAGIEKRLNVYAVDTALNEIFSQSYNDYLTAPLTRQTYAGTNIPMTNLLLIKLNATEPPVASARLFTIDRTTSTEIGSATIDGSVSSYGRLQVTKSGDIACVLIDAYKIDSSMITDVIYFDDASGMLKAPTFNPKTQQTEQTFRRRTIDCRDIDGDGIIEIPYLSELPSIDATELTLTGDTSSHSTSVVPASDNRVYLTNWMRYDVRDPAKSVSALTAQMNYYDDYYVRFPEKWLYTEAEAAELEFTGNALSRVAVRRDIAARESVFYEYDYVNLKPAVTLFTIKVFQESNWDAKIASDFIMLKKAGGLVYGLQLAESTSPLALTERELRETYFSTINYQ